MFAMVSLDVFTQVGEMRPKSSGFQAFTLAQRVGDETLGAQDKPVGGFPNGERITAQMWAKSAHYRNGVLRGNKDQSQNDSMREEVSSIPGERKAFLCEHEILP